MAKILKVNGEVKDLTLHEGENDAGRTALELLQQAVGGYIEPVHLADGRTLFVDEEGRLKGKRVNRQASLLLPTGLVVGDAVLAEEGEVA
jgi:hypothetical protein